MKWKELALTIFFILFCVGVGLIAARLFPQARVVDKSVNSRNISAPESDPTYPYVGIWKANPEDSFGVIIEKAENAMYSVSFFGPGGRFEPGTWRPNTKILGDPGYRVVDENTIDIGSTRYHRVSTKADEPSS